MIIAIDTSTEIASLALVNGKEIIAEMTWHSRQNHSVQLLPNLSFLMERFNLSKESATGIVVARGPGSFNGLRVGVSTAKGLAYGLNIPVAGISTLEVEAYAFADTNLPVCAIHNAGREEISAGIFRRQKGKWTRLVEEHITTTAALSERIKVRTIFCGEYLTSVAEKLVELMGNKAIIAASPAAALRRASYLAELGQARLNNNDYDDVKTLQPLYLRQPPINERKHL